MGVWELTVLKGLTLTQDNWKAFKLQYRVEEVCGRVGPRVKLAHYGEDGIAIFNEVTNYFFSWRELWEAIVYKVFVQKKWVS